MRNEDAFWVMIGFGAVVVLFLAAFTYSFLRSPQRQQRISSIICPNPNCAYKGPAKAQVAGNLWIFLILLACFGVPGFIYLLAVNSYNYFCPACGVKARSE